MSSSPSGELRRGRAKHVQHMLNKRFSSARRASWTNTQNMLAGSSPWVVAIRPRPADIGVGLSGQNAQSGRHSWIATERVAHRESSTFYLLGAFVLCRDRHVVPRRGLHTGPLALGNGGTSANTFRPATRLWSKNKNEILTRILAIRKARRDGVGFGCPKAPGLGAGLWTRLRRARQEGVVMRGVLMTPAS